MTAKSDNEDEDISTETIVAPPPNDDEQQLYDNHVQTFEISRPEDEEDAEEEEEDDLEDEEKFYFQKFLATRRGKGGGGGAGGGGGGGGGWDRSKSLPSVHANGGVSYRLLGRRNFSGFGGLLDRVLEHGGSGSDFEDGGEVHEEDEERRERTRCIRYVGQSQCRPPCLSTTTRSR